MQRKLAENASLASLLDSGSHLDDQKPLQVLFLGYGSEETRLIALIEAAGCELTHTQEVITSTQGFDLVVSFGYRHIVPAAVIAASSAPILNLHIAYLPWNRGAHPNFWSFFDGTPSGVTIHLMDAGIDTGAILYQKRVDFPPELRTFSQTYAYLLAEIEALFAANLPEILTKTFTPKTQVGAGSYHALADLPAEFAGWDAEIASEISRLKALLQPNC